jgi:hypothetical protein
MGGILLHGGLPKGEGRIRGDEVKMRGKSERIS